MRVRSSRSCFRYRLGYCILADGKTVVLDNTPSLQLILDLLTAPPKKLFSLLHSSQRSMVYRRCLPLIRSSMQLSLAMCRQINAHGYSVRFKIPPSLKCCLPHPACMSHSLTLTAATTTIWAGPVTSLDVFGQANARFFRVGQKRRPWSPCAEEQQQKKKSINY